MQYFLSILSSLRQMVAHCPKGMGHWDWFEMLLLLHGTVETSVDARVLKSGPKCMIFGWDYWVGLSQFPTAALKSVGVSAEDASGEKRFHSLVADWKKECSRVFVLGCRMRSLFS